MTINKQESRTVLLVEDYEDTREFMRMLLEMKGCRVLEASDGQKAIEIAAQMCPHLILMDLNLPIMSGYEATRQILAQPVTCDVPIVAFSAQCSDERRERALEAGCVECLQKPIDFKAVDELIGRYLPPE